VKVGPERKKLMVLVGLVAVAVVIWLYQFQSSPTTPAAAPPARSIPTARKELRATADEILENRSAPKSRPGNRSSDFKPSLKKKPGELDADKVDPTLRTDLLEKVQSVEYQGAERNLFQFGAAKPKPTPQQIEDAKKEAAQAAEKLAAEAKNTPPAEPAKPQAPPINLKYYGYANRPGDLRKRAFLMDGEDIVVATEGEVVKKRYKIVRIGVNSIVMEDLDFHNQQTLPLQESG
jgi:hypothetical protein